MRPTSRFGAARNCALRVVFTSLASLAVGLTFGGPLQAAEPLGNRTAPTTDERDMLDRAEREQRAALEAKREAELSTLSDKLRRVREARGGRPPSGAASPTGATANWQTEVFKAPNTETRPGLERGQRFALGAGPPVVRAQNEGRATILMVMTPGTRGIRRFDGSADPVLCTDDGCYVSQGPTAQAELRGRRGVLGVQNTFGERAGACRNQLGCVFRDVEIGTGSALIAPIDLRVLKHDRRPTTVVALDASCKVTLDRIVCNQPYVGDGYTVWVVPEAVAKEAGSERLQRAVEQGLRR